jgi:NAD(P)-dependent dehydrogenase (short-subunit alcohol dehydrogenase family)
MPRPLENVPLRRLGTAEDVAQAVLFFASDQSRFITGQTLLVNGGVIV